MSKLDQHELLSLLTNTAIDLGRTPTRDEFIKQVKNGKQLIDLHFGSYSTMIHAAGLESPRVGKKIDNSVFDVNIHSHLEKYYSETVQNPPPETYPTIAIISDIHWPFHNQRVIDKFYKYVSDHKPKYVIINGDAMDLYSYAKFPRSHNQFTPREETELARQLNEDFWKEIKKLHPNAICAQNLGNHCVRPLKRMLESFPEAEDWVTEGIKKLFTFEGVETNHSPRQELTIGGIIIHHGFKSTLGEHRDHYLQNTISSHTHRPGVVYKTVRENPIWELNTGYAGDPKAKGLTYTATRTVAWVNSFGVVDSEGPRVIMG